MSSDDIDLPAVQVEMAVLAQGVVSGPPVAARPGLLPRERPTSSSRPLSTWRPNTPRWGVLPEVTRPSGRPSSPPYRGVLMVANPLRHRSESAAMQIHDALERYSSTASIGT